MSKKEENKPPNKKLILYFDLDKTILLQDSAQNLSKEEHILAGQAWGRLEQKDEKSPVVWKLYFNHFSNVQPEKDVIDYLSYIESLYPLKTDKDDPDAENREKFNKQMKLTRNTFYLNLVKTGGPGIKLKPEYDRMLKSITLPKLVGEYIKNELARAEHEEETGQAGYAVSSEEEKIIDLLSDGFYNIIPSFFRTIISLKKQKREFSVVFRTFGEDQLNVNREINAFCAGEHPCFNGRNNMPIAKFDGSKNNKSFKIKGLHSGVLYRNNSGDTANTELVLGTSKRSKQPAQPLVDFYAQEIKAGTVKILKGHHQIHALIAEMLKETCALSIQDDYLAWKNNNFSVSYAKPLILDQTDYLTQHIFFDDWESADDENIVDVRDLITGNPISPSRSINKFIVKVDRVEAIKDPDFFLKSIDICEKARAEEIERIEKQLPLVDVEDQQQPNPIAKKSDFQILQESEADVYLRKTILPLLNPVKQKDILKLFPQLLSNQMFVSLRFKEIIVLLKMFVIQALRICDLERPQDPIAFIALFCLKNKERLKIPLPPPDFFEKDKIEDEDHDENTQQQHQSGEPPIIPSNAAQPAGTELKKDAK